MRVCACVYVSVCGWVVFLFCLPPSPFPRITVGVQISCPRVRLYCLSVCLSVCPSVNPCVGLSTCADHLQKIRSVELGGFVISLGLALRERDPE